MAYPYTHIGRCWVLQGMFDQGFMQQMMQSPMVQQLLSDPETMRNMLQMNPGIREVRALDVSVACRHACTCMHCHLTYGCAKPLSSLHKHNEDLVPGLVVPACTCLGLHACAGATSCTVRQCYHRLHILVVCMLQLMDRDPQMAQMLNNPELLRESLNMMANPVS